MWWQQKALRIFAGKQQQANSSKQTAAIKQQQANIRQTAAKCCREREQLQQRAPH